MRTVIVFESLFGNTERLARAIGAGLATDGAQVALAEVRHVRPEDVRGCDLLVVGAPTHAFSLSRPNTREDAVRQGAGADRAESGVREWLSTLHETWGAERRPAVAAFDTRVEQMRRWPGSAARKTARSLGHEGFELLEPGHQLLRRGRQGATRRRGAGPCPGVGTPPGRPGARGARSPGVLGEGVPGDREGHSSSIVCIAASSALAPAPSMPSSSAYISLSTSSWEPSSGAIRRPVRRSPTSPPA